MCDGKHFFFAQTSGGHKNKMKSLSYLISCIKKNKQSNTKRVNHDKNTIQLKIEKTEANLNKHGIRTLRKVQLSNLSKII